MLKSKPKSWATLVIRGENLEPSRITNILSVNPDFVVGQDILNLNEKESTPHWQLNSNLPPDREIEEHIFEILKRIAPKRKAMREKSVHWECVLYVSVEVASLNVEGLKLSPRVLLLLGDLGIQLEFLPWIGS